MNSAKSPLRLSVILCSHNGAVRLAPTLQHLAAQVDLAGDRWEVVLVDNASTDGTAVRAREIWQESGAPAELRIVSEPRLGVAHARMAGIMVARHEIASFVDDDNWVCPTWCATVLRLMSEQPGIGAIVGRSEAAFELGQEVPGWFAALQHGYAVGPLGERTGWVETALPRYPTAGFSFRRELVLALLARGFSTLLTGRSGKQLTAGEDAELTYALGMAGCRFWYEESLVFRHYMPPGRLTEDYALRLYHGLGVASALEDLYRDYGQNRTHFGWRGRLKRVGAIAYMNVRRKILRYRLRALLSAWDSAARSQARIEASFFQGRLEGMRRYRGERQAVYEHIARWAKA